MFFDIIGWVGMILMLLAYFLLSLNIIKNGMLYQLINLFAALFMAMGLFPKNAWFSFVLQVFWGIVSIIAIFRIINKKYIVNNK